MFKLGVGIFFLGGGGVQGFRLKSRYFDQPVQGSALSIGWQVLCRGGGSNARLGGGGGGGATVEITLWL